MGNYHAIKVANFKQRYCDRKYTKEDLLNPNIWKEDEFRTDSKELFMRWAPQQIELVEACADVAKSSPENITLEIKGIVDPNCRHELVLSTQLYNTERDLTYDFKPSDSYLKNTVLMQPSNERPYVFYHPSNIRTYFNSLHKWNPKSKF